MAASKARGGMPTAAPAPQGVVPLRPGPLASSSSREGSAGRRRLRSARAMQCRRWLGQTGGGFGQRSAGFGQTGGASDSRRLRAGRRWCGCGWVRHACQRGLRHACGRRLRTGRGRNDRRRVWTGRQRLPRRWRVRAGARRSRGRRLRTTQRLRTGGRGRRWHRTAQCDRWWGLRTAQCRSGFRADERRRWQWLRTDWRRRRLRAAERLRAAQPLRRAAAAGAAAAAGSSWWIRWLGLSGPAPQATPPPRGRPPPRQQPAPASLVVAGSPAAAFGQPAAAGSPTVAFGQPAVQHGAASGLTRRGSRVRADRGEGVQARGPREPPQAA